MAEQRSPFGTILPFPGTRQGGKVTPLTGDNAGGGGLAPRPPNRFKEIMDQAPKVERPVQAEFKLKWTETDKRETGLNREYKPVERMPAEPQTPARDDFMSRRGAQLDAERVQASAVEKAKVGEEARQKRASDMQLQKDAEAMAYRLNQSGPREVTPEVPAAQGLDLAPAKANMGIVTQYVPAKDATLLMNPKTGTVRLRRGSKVLDFGSREEALKALQSGDPFRETDGA